MGVILESKNEKATTELSKDAEAAVNKDKRKIGPLLAAIHLFKGMVGAGLFAMGDGFKNGGLLGATLMMPILAAISAHCGQLLIFGSVHAVQNTPGATFFDYPDTVEKCFAYGPKPARRLSKLMRLIVEIFICITQFGFCAVYFVFITENMHQVLHQNGILYSPNLVMLLTLVPVMIPSLVTNLKYISPVSLAANIALIFGLVATLVLAVKEGPMPALVERHWVTNAEQTALFFGTALFAYEGVALILPLRNAMKSPDKFSSRFGVLNAVVSLITIVFVFTGFVTYLRWGEDVEASITLNLNVTDILAQIIKIVAAIGVFFGYPIQFYCMIRIIWTPIKRSMVCAQNHPVISQVIFRFLMVLVTFFVALVVPQLGLFISLIGALCSTSLAFLIPVLIDFVVRSQMPKPISCWIYLKNIAIIIIAVLGIFTGTYQSIAEIVKVFKL